MCTLVRSVTVVLILIFNPNYTNKPYVGFDFVATIVEESVYRLKITKLNHLVASQPIRHYLCHVFYEVILLNHMLLRPSLPVHNPLRKKSCVKLVIRVPRY
jgi:hypothetical protein